MAWGINRGEDGQWRWWIALSAYGAATGLADSEDEAARDLKAAQDDLLAEERWDGIPHPDLASPMDAPDALRSPARPDDRPKLPR